MTASSDANDSISGCCSWSAATPSCRGFGLRAADRVEKWSPAGRSDSGKSSPLIVPLADNFSCFVRADFVRVKQTQSARRRTVRETTRLAVEIHSTLSKTIPKVVNVEY